MKHRQIVLEYHSWYWRFKDLRREKYFVLWNTKPRIHKVAIFRIKKNA